MICCFFFQHASARRFGGAKNTTYDNVHISILNTYSFWLPRDTPNLFLSVNNRFIVWFFAYLSFQPLIASLLLFLALRPLLLRYLHAFEPTGLCDSRKTTTISLEHRLLNKVVAGKRSSTAPLSDVLGIQAPNTKKTQP